MSGLPFWKSAEIGLFRPFSAFLALFRKARRAPGMIQKTEEKGLFPQISSDLLPPFAAPQSLEFLGFSGPLGGQGQHNLSKATPADRRGEKIFLCAN